MIFKGKKRKTDVATSLQTYASLHHLLLSGFYAIKKFILKQFACNCMIIFIMNTYENPYTRMDFTLKLYTYWIILMASIGPRVPIVNLLVISKYMIFMKRLMTSSFQIK